MTGADGAVVSGIFPGKNRCGSWTQGETVRYFAACAAGFEPDEPCPACKSVCGHEPGCRYDELADVWEPARTDPAAVAAARERTAS